MITTAATIIILSVAMIVLAGVMVTVSYLGQRARQAAPYVIEIEAAEARLRVLRSDTEIAQNELEMARRRVDEAARTAAEVAALIEQRDSLIAEINNMAGQREELGAIERQRADLVLRHEAVAAQVRGTEAELANLNDRLERAKAAEARLADLVERITELERRREELEREVADLRALMAERDALRRTVEDTSDQVARLTATIEAETSRLDEVRDARARAGDELRQAQGAVADARDALAEVRAEVAVARYDIGEVRDEVDELRARKARLEDEIAKQPGNKGSAGADVLSDLREDPPLLKGLKADEWTGARGAPLQEAEALHGLSKHLAASRLVYSQRTLRAFHTALKSSDQTQLTVLAGISGTGKSQLPRHYAEAMGLGFLPVPVQPRWDSPQDLMGFYNYIESRYRATDLARCMWHMDRHHEGAGQLGDRMLLVLLDEMNLARVEYYFSDFLSRLESRPSRADEDRPEARRDAEIVLELPRSAGNARIFPGRNIVFAGTMNEDESTQSLSDKVVDRANLMRFASPAGAVQLPPAGQTQPAPAPLSRARWAQWHRTAADLQPNDRSQAAAIIEKLARLMAEAGRPIGYRLRQAIMEYVANYPLSDGEDCNVLIPLADQIEMRLLPKLRGVELEAHENHVADLAELARRELGDEPLAEALRHSLERSAVLGQFAWHGLARPA